MMALQREAWGQRVGQPVSGQRTFKRQARDQRQSGQVADNAFRDFIRRVYLNRLELVKEGRLTSFWNY